MVHPCGFDKTLIFREMSCDGRLGPSCDWVDGELTLGRENVAGRPGNLSTEELLSCQHTFPG